MANENLALRIAAVFIIFLASFIGIVFPLLAETKSTLFRVLNTGSAGVMLGLALMHLLPSADEMLSEELPGFPWSNCLTGAGVVLVLSIEQFALMVSMGGDSDIKKTDGHHDYHAVAPADDVLSTPLLSSDEHDHKEVHSPLIEDHGHDHGHDSRSHSHDHGHESASHDHDHGHDSEHDHGHDHGHVSDHDHDHSHCRSSTPVAAPTDDRTMSFDHVNHHAIRQVSLARDNLGGDHGDHAGHDHDHDHGLGNVMQSHSLQKLITAYVLEISIAVHSVIIGVDLGMLSEPGETVTIISLIVALFFHQFIEGVGLGSAIQASRGSLGDSKVLGFVAIFSLTMPMGIVIGIASSETVLSRSQAIAKGFADAFAAGSLLYISLSEMVADYFTEPDLKRRPQLRLAMMLAFASGMFMMALIANWA